MYGPILAIHFRIFLLLKHSLIFYTIDRSTNKKYLCDNNIGSFLNKTNNCFFTSM